MKAALTSMAATLARLFGPAQPRPVRVGVLNTGELVLVDGAGQAQVLPADTTALIRQAMADETLQLVQQALADADAVFGDAPVGAGGTA